MEEAVKELILIFEQIYEVKYTGKAAKMVPGNSITKCLSPQKCRTTKKGMLYPASSAQGYSAGRFFMSQASD